jgi:hypothetical protein
VKKSIPRIESLYSTLRRLLAAPATGYRNVLL